MNTPTGNGTHRLFVSIPIERHFHNVISKYRDKNGRIPYLKWTPERKLHITVLYIGAVPDEHCEDVAATLQEVSAQHVPYALELDRIGYAPPERTYDMVWAFWSPHAALDTYSHALYHALAERTIIPEDSFKNGIDPLLPHTTLARFRKGYHVGELMDLPRLGLERHNMLVERAELLMSRTTPRGSEYTQVSSLPLKH